MHSLFQTFTPLHSLSILSKKVRLSEEGGASSVVGGAGLFFHPLGGTCRFVPLCGTPHAQVPVGMPLASPSAIPSHACWWMFWCLQCMGCGRSGLRGACVQSRVGVARGHEAEAVWFFSMETSPAEGQRCRPSSAI